MRSGAGISLWRSIVPAAKVKGVSELILWINSALNGRSPGVVRIYAARTAANARRFLRDPEVSSTKTGNDWYLGIKAHIGVDAESGAVHSLETSTAKVHDSKVWDALLQSDGTSVWVDSGHVSAGRAAGFSKGGKVWGVMRKAPKGSDLHPIDARINRIIAMLRAKVEHPFRVIKRRFGYVKTRYRGLAKNRAQLFALGKLFLVRRRLMA